MSGAELCKRLRSFRFDRPILIPTAIGDEVDKVLLLEMGTDDYIVKTFGMRELLARVRAVMRRSVPDRDGVLSFADVEIDVTRRLVTRAGLEVKLTPLEYRLLTFFVRRTDAALTREEILRKALAAGCQRVLRAVEHLGKWIPSISGERRRPESLVLLFI